MDDKTSLGSARGRIVVGTTYAGHEHPDQAIGDTETVTKSLRGKLRNMRATRTYSRPNQKFPGR